MLWLFNKKKYSINIQLFFYSHFKTQLFRGMKFLFCFSSYRNQTHRLCISYCYLHPKSEIHYR